MPRLASARPAPGVETPGSIPSSLRDEGLASRSDARVEPGNSFPGGARNRHWLASALAALCLAAGCGPSQEPASTTVVDDQDESPPPVDHDGMAVEGITGTLNRDEVDPVMNRAVQRFQRCYVEAFEDHPFLAGDLALQFTVGPDGSVRDVVTTASTLGSQPVEECILAIARSLTFSRPRGGREAVFDYGPMVMSSDDGVPFAPWTVENIPDQAEAVAQLWASCTEGAPGFQIYLYVGPGGQVRSAGAVAPADSGEGGLEAARCLERELQSVVFADPGPGRIAKLMLEM